MPEPMRFFRQVALALAVAAGLALSAAVPPAAAQSADPGLLARVAAYLNGISTMQARFTQINQNGSAAQGDFYLSRPGRMRIDYDPPVPYLYIADGFMLTFWDAELEQRNDVMLGTTLADFITRENITLSGDVTVRSAVNTGDLIEIELVQTEDPAAGTLTLRLTPNPMQLVSWVVVDAEGTATEVVLEDARYGVSLPSRLFVSADNVLPRQ
jgi:outer membrane lipoprotein-sorting protein